MDWNHIKNEWNTIKIDLQRQWPKITNQDLDDIQGNRQLLLNKLAEKYGDIQITPEMQLQNWENQNENLSGFNLNESGAKYSKKYNPDYSETDSTLNHNRENSDHEEKSIDQT